MLLTPEQLREVQQIIAEHHAAFAANAMGHDAIPPELLEELRKKGLITDEQINAVAESYTYGQLLGKMESTKAAKMSYADFRRQVADEPIPFNDTERGYMRMAAMSAGQYCRGLGNRVDVSTGAMLIEADRKLRARMEGDISSATEGNVAKKQAVDKLRSDLGWATKDWARDLERIAITEKVTAMNHGTSDLFKKEHGADTLVSKIAMPDACKHCQRLYNGSTGPRVMKLSTMEGNGTNVGKKAQDWLPVVGSTHPRCQ